MNSFQTQRFVRILCVAIALCQSTSAFSQLDSTKLGDETNGPVDRSKPLEVIRDDFALVDGCSSNGALLYVPDVKGNQLYSYRSTASSEPWKKVTSATGAYSGSCFQLGQLYLADNKGAKIVRSNGFGKPQVFHEFADGARPNDITVDHNGNVYATLTGQGEVRRITQEGKVSVVAKDIVRPNGVAVSPDGNTLYFSSVKTGVIWQLNVRNQSKITEPVEFAKIPTGDNGPQADGMTVDRAGNVYGTGFDSVWIWNSQGTLLDRLKTPSRPINCAFGGQHGLDLYISTFDGLLRQAMKEYGVQPNPATSGKAATPDGNASTGIPDNLTALFNQVYYQEGSRKLLCDIIHRESDDAGRPAILVVHGGGWLHGDKTKFRALSIKLAKLGYVVMSVEYRLGFEERFPAAIHDCNAATRFLRSNATRFNIDPDRIAAVGGSAGGHLVGLMATGSDTPKLQPIGSISLGLNTIESKSSRLKAAVVMAGPMEISSGSVAAKSVTGSQSNAIKWIGGPIDGGFRETYGLCDAYLKISPDDPPILFIRGSLDNPPADNPSLKAFKANGVPAKQIIHEGAKHGHWNRVDWMDRVVDDIHQFLNLHL